MKKNRTKKKDLIFLGFIGAIVFIVVWILLCPEKDKIIQAELIVILVFVTIFYAIQTQRLVKEEKKKNTADFWEKRLIEFYKPFIDKLNEMNDAVYERPIKKDRILEIYKSATHLTWKRDYMISEQTCKKIEKILMILHQTQNYREGDSLKEYRDLEKEVRRTIVDEWNDIKDALRKIYAIEKKEVEKRKKKQK